MRVLQFFQAHPLHQARHPGPMLDEADVLLLVSAKSAVDPRARSGEGEAWS